MRRARRRTGRGAKPPRAAPKRRAIWRRLAGAALRALIALVALAVLWVGAYRWIDPPGGYYMLTERVRLGGLDRDWRDLDEMSAHLLRAAMAAEDARFCAHNGFDFAAIQAALAANAQGKRVRGGSTISQQVAKNVFLWHRRSWLRKGLEAGFTVLIETLWPKRRILEVYLNMAEFDDGIFGAEAAARHHFGRAAADLSRIQAARLAAVLPGPKTRDPARPSAFLRRRAGAIAAGAEDLRLTGRDICAFGG